jgi:hypothetical protein
MQTLNDAQHGKIENVVNANYRSHPLAPPKEDRTEYLHTG